MASKSDASGVDGNGDDADADDATPNVEESLARFTSASNVDSNVEMGSCDARFRRFRESFREMKEAAADKVDCGGGDDAADGCRRDRDVREAAKLFPAAGLRNLVMSLGAILVVSMLNSVSFASSGKLRHGLTKM